MTSRIATVFLTSLLAMGGTAAAGAANDDAAAGGAFPHLERATLSARLSPIPVVLDTSAHVGERARIYLRFVDLTDGGAALAGLRWREHGRSSVTLASPGERRLIFEGVIDRASLTEVLDFDVLCTSLALNGTTVLRPVFELERVDARARVSNAAIPARHGGGGPLLVPVPVWSLDGQGSAGVRAGRDQQGSTVAITPTGRGVRLERGVSGMRFTFVPEAASDHGLSVGGAFASTLLGGAAGIVASTGDRRDEVILNTAWPLAGGRLLVTAGQLREQMAFSFGSDLVRERMTQRGGGVGYETALGGVWAAMLNVQAYAYGTPSREAGSTAFMVDYNETREYFRAERRVAGSRLRGLESRASFAPRRGTRITMGIGAEQLGFRYQTGRESQSTVTGGVALSQQLPARLALQVSEDRYASQTLRRVSVGRGFGDNRHHLELGLQAIDGRQGLLNDRRFRVGYSLSFRNAASPSQRTGAVARELFSPVDALLSQVSSRPSFMPFRPIARVDTTMPVERLVVVHKDQLPANTTIDPVSGTMTIPTASEGIVSVTRNGAAFENTGQFSHSGEALLVHPMLMSQPEPDATDWYVVVLRDEGGLLTDVTIAVEKGSIRVVSVSVGEPRDGDAPPQKEKEEEEAPVDTTPNAFSFTLQTGVSRSSVVVSNSITVAGIDAAAAIAIEGGEYSIAGGDYTSAPGTVSSGQAVTVRQTSSKAYSTMTSAVLTVGGVSASFDVKTESEPADTTPDQFYFAGQYSVTPYATYTSNGITVSGINAPATITVSGSSSSEYSINDGAFTSQAGTVQNGDVVRVRHFVEYYAESSVTIGGVTGWFWTETYCW